MHKALRRAESFGDIGGIVAAQYSYGIVLLNAENGSPDEALDVLDRVRTSVKKHTLFNFAVASVDAVLEIDAARGKGNWRKQSMSFGPLSRYT